jgi:hypothetical protein
MDQNKTNNTAPSPPSAGDDIDALIQEFDTATGAEPAAKPVPTETTPPQPEGQLPESRVPDERREPVPDNLFSSDAEEEVYRALDAAVAYDQQRLAARDAADGALVVKAIRGEFPASQYPDEMVAGWIENLARTNPKIQEAWVQRYSGADGERNYRRAVERLGQAFHKQFKSTQIDHAATEDRAAVAAAMRGTARPPDAENDGAYRRRVSNMTDNEFQVERERLYG